MPHEPQADGDEDGAGQAVMDPPAEKYIRLRGQSYVIIRTPFTP